MILDNKTVLSFFAAKRTLISKILGISILIVFLFSNNYWDTLANSIGQKLLFGAFPEITGIMLIIICCFGRIWCSTYICGNKSHVIIKEGPYSAVRNPLYFFSFLGTVGIGLATESITLLLTLVFLFIFYYYFTVLNEERVLKEIHGQNYIDYMNSVPRFIPKWSQLKEPHLYEIKPLDHKKTYFDVIWFFIFFLLVHFIEELHEALILPTFFRIF